MQKVTVLCVGKLKEAFYAAAVAEYQKRLARHCKLEIVELPEQRLSENPSRAEIEQALAKEAAQRGGNVCAALNGANEAAVALYLRDEICFYDIPRLVRCAMDAVPFRPNPELSEILLTDAEARRIVLQNL